MLILLLMGIVLAANPWDKYNLSPATRELSPVRMIGTQGAVFPFVLSSARPFVVLDFGQEVGGFSTVLFGAVAGSPSVGLAYSESLNYASCPSSAVGACEDGKGQFGAGDHSNGGSGPDGVITTGTITANTNFTPPASLMRGGFRYVNVFLAAGESVEITGFRLHFTPSPLMATPNAYVNHFYSSDDMLNRIWYACAYTAQMCTIDSSQGRQWGPPAKGWNNAVLIGAGKSLLVDGAKRDRTIWPGDMGVSTASSFVTLGDTISSINSLDTLYALQRTAASVPRDFNDPRKGVPAPSIEVQKRLDLSEEGMLPYVGPEVFCQQPWGVDCGGNGSWASDTYHLWALAGTSNLVHYLGNNKWLSQVWTGYKKALECSLGKVVNGLMVVTAAADWQRGDQGDQNIAANALLAHNLLEGAELAKLMNDTAAAQRFASAASSLQASVNKILWNETRGCFIDNPTSSLCPQDGNSLMLWFNLSTPHRQARVSTYLTTNWVALGSLSPEWQYNGKTAIGTFPGSMEVLGHLSSGHTDRGLDLIKREWGYMLDSANSTQSTFWEGYQADGQFAFDGIYMSHAHGWATGPAPALTFYLLGLQVSVSQFRVVPQFTSSLEFAEGSLSLGETRGLLRTSWHRLGSSYILVVDATNVTVSGVVGVPMGSAQVVSMDGRVAWEKGVVTGYGLELGAQIANHRLWFDVSLSSKVSFTVDL